MSLIDIGTAPAGSDGDTNREASQAINDFVASATFGPSVGQINDLGWEAFFEAAQLPVVADGTALSTFTDESGNGNNATQTGSARPVYKDHSNGIGGNPTVRFDGTNDQMATAAGAAGLSSDFYMAGLVRFVSTSGFQSILSFGDNSAGERRSILKGSIGFHAEAILFIGETQDVLSDSPVVTTNTPYLVEVTRVSGVVSVFLNGILVSTGSPTLSAYSSTALILGANLVNGEFFSGDIAFAGFSSTPTSAFVSRTRLYAASVYGVPIYNALGAINAVTALIAGLLFTPTLAEPLISVSLNGRNVLLLANTNEDSTDSYSAIAFRDPGLGTKYEKGAVGLGRSNSSLYPWRAIYLESFEGQGNDGDILPIRLVQTKNSGGYAPYRRIQFTGGTDPGNIVFYNPDAPYPNETPCLIIKTTGVINTPLLPTSASGLASGDLWNDGNTVKVVP